MAPHADSPGSVTSGIRRRSLVVAAATALAALAGCLDGPADESGPRERSFDVAVTVEDGEPAGTVAGTDIEGVVRVDVGDTAAFTFANGADEPVGVHDHASGTEVVIEPGGERSVEFEATESMIGRQEIEAWVADGRDDEGGGGHGRDATSIVIVEVRPRGN